MRDFLSAAILLALATTAEAGVSFSYRNAPNQAPMSVGNLDQINTAPTLVGSTSTITLIVQNTGTTAVTFKSIDLTGQGFADSGNVSSGLPVDIAAGGSRYRKRCCNSHGVSIHWPEWRTERGVFGTRDERSDVAVPLRRRWVG